MELEICVYILVLIWKKTSVDKQLIECKSKKLTQDKHFVNNLIAGMWLVSFVLCPGVNCLSWYIMDSLEFMASLHYRRSNCSSAYHKVPSIRTVLTLMAVVSGLFKLLLYVF